MARTKLERRIKRKMRIRKKISGTAGCPRLSVFKSNKHLYVQVVDDSASQTVASASSYEKAFKEGSLKANKSGAVKIGAMIAERMLARGIKRVVFDRNGLAYHGCVKALADAVREKGLVF